MIYKTLKKVSDYCQLLDKSKYPATQTINGVTFTNNGDGTITVNGTATEDAFISAGAIGVIKGHKYLWKSTPVGGAGSTFHSYITGNMEQFYIDTGSGTISTAKDDGVTYTVLARVKFSTTVSNLVFKPQLFDLTEMFGAGNEPTTVEEFKADFPNDLYDYKPYCFVPSYKTLLKASDNKIITSYKKSLICTTKNLFDISKVTETNKLKVIGNSIYSYYYPVVCDDTSTLSIFKSLKPDTNYTMSATTLNYLGDATNHIMLFFSNTNDYKIIFYNYSAGFNKVTFSLTQEQINNITNVYFYGRDESSGGPTIWSNIQLEEGSTATEYHPYGYL